jgi:hypothetical protein
MSWQIIYMCAPAPFQTISALINTDVASFSISSIPGSSQSAAAEQLVSLQDQFDCAGVHMVRVSEQSKSSYLPPFLNLRNPYSGGHRSGRQPQVSAGL